MPAGFEPATRPWRSSSPACWRSAMSAAVKRAIDTAAAKSDITKNAELMKLVNDVRGGGNAWVVGRFDAMTKQREPADEVKAHLPAVQSLRRERARERRRQRHCCAPRRATTRPPQHLRRS